MKIRMKTLASGPNGRLLPDHVYDSKVIGDRFAKNLVDGGYAEKVLPAAPASAGEVASEKRTVKPPEQATDEAEETAAEESEEQASEIDATPGAVKYAEKHGVDLNLVTGTGTNGRIQQPDVVDHIKAQEADAGEEQATDEAEETAAEESEA